MPSTADYQRIICNRNVPHDPLAVKGRWVMENVDAESEIRSDFHIGDIVGGSAASRHVMGGLRPAQRWILPS